jgi:hypothetical protein
MARSIRAGVLIAVAGSLVAACVPAKPEMAAFRTPTQPRGLTCDTATANVLTFGRSTAKLYSEIALKHQVSELRGYMFASGIRRIQLVQQTSDCVAAHSGGLYQCTSRAQLCGR